MALTTSQLAPVIGSILTGIDLARDMTDSTMREVVALLFERGVVVIPGQTLGDAEYVHFAGYFGSPLEFFIPEHRNPDHPEIIHINNDPATPEMMRDGAVHWHSDSSYEAVPGCVTMLYGKLTPEQGGRPSSPARPRPMTPCPKRCAGSWMAWWRCTNWAARHGSMAKPGPTLIARRARPTRPSIRW